MNAFWQDLRYGARMLLKNPGFTLVAIITLALGIGANTAIFSVVNGVLLKALPFPEPDRLIQVSETRRGDFVNGPVSPMNLKDWRERSQTLAEIAGYRYSSFTLTGGERPEALTGIESSANFFSTLGVQPAMGRNFETNADNGGEHRVAIISYRLWQRRFAADPQIINQAVQVNNQPFTIIGVMPVDFTYPNRNIDIWVPFSPEIAKRPRGSHFLTAFARLQTGATLDQSRDELNEIASQIEAESGNSPGVRLIPLQESIVGQSRSSILLMMGAVGLVLLVACVNVANLLLARALGRQKEIAVRTALGAGRGRIIRQLLTESLVLAAAGGGLGLLLASWGLDGLLALNRSFVPRSDNIQLDSGVLWFTLAISLLTGLVFGVLPALQATRVDINHALKESGKALSGSRGSRRLRRALVVAEIALSLTLLVSAGLLLKSFWKLQEVDPGFQSASVLTFTVALPRAVYPDHISQRLVAGRIIESLAALPGAETVGTINDLPFAGSRSGSSFSIDGRPATDGPGPSADYREASPDYFKAMGIPVVQGRAFADTDRKESQGVAIINAEAARRFFPNEDPVGKHLTIGSPEEEAIYGKAVSREIVGVVGNIKLLDLGEESHPEMYVPFAQMPSPRFSVAIRSFVKPDTLITDARSAVLSVDKDLPLRDVRVMAERVETSLAPQKFNAFALGVFSLSALALACAGLFSVMSYMVTQRTNEIGIRIALGAQAKNIFAMVLREGMTLAAIGITLGTAGSLLLSSFLSKLLYGVSATDVATFVLVAFMLAGVTLLACFVPARRATKVDPMVALRYE